MIEVVELAPSVDLDRQLEVDFNFELIVGVLIYINL